MVNWCNKIVENFIDFLVTKPNTPLRNWLLEKSYRAKISFQLSIWPRVRRRPGFDSASQTKAVFHTVLFAILGKLARVDDSVDPDEVKAVEEFAHISLRMNPRDKLESMRNFCSGKNSRTPFEKLIKQYRQIFHDNIPMLRHLIDVMCYLAFSDGDMSEKEEHLIRKAVTITKLGEEVFDELYGKHYEIYLTKRKLDRLLKKQFDDPQKDFSEYSQNESERTVSTGELTPIQMAYRILDSTPSDSIDTIEEQYRKLIFDKHPDRLPQDEQNSEKLAEARRQFRDILRAWKIIKEERSSSESGDAPI